MSRPARILCTFFLALTLGIAGCTSGPPNEAPGISGTITSIERSADGTIVLLVESVPGGPAQMSGQPVGDKASVRVGTDTPVVNLDGSDARPGLKEGMTAEVWFEGAVAESYPVQGTAAYVRVGPMMLGGAAPTTSAP